MKLYSQDSNQKRTAKSP